VTAGKGFKRLVRARARRTGESYAAARRALLAKRSEDSMTTVEREEQLVEVTVDGVRRFDENTAVVLREADGGRQLPVFIGAPEAAAIAFALQGVATLRPMTHDALKQMVDALGARPLRVQIGFVPEAATFTADVTVALPDGTERHLDWRVSDAVALAVRTDPRPTVLVPAALLDMPHPKFAAVDDMP
jgi:bifunctional DNase/RNase